MASIKKQPSGRWQARYYDQTGKQHARRFDRKTDAQQWLDQQTSALVTGTHVDPRTARQTVDQRCDTWLAGYGFRAAGTVRQARVHVRLIREAFGTMPLSSVRPSAVKAWTARLAEQGYEPSYVYAVYRRLAQIMGDAVHHGIIPRSEVCFATLAGLPLAHPKWSWAGAEDRRRLLASAGIQIPAEIGVAGELASVDDVLDAAAASSTAQRYAEGSATCHPETAEQFDDGPVAAIWA
jgi:hypothetical protein